MKQRLYWCLAVVILVVAVYRFASGRKPSVSLQAWFGRCDLNKDGKIGADEFSRISSPADSLDLYDHNG